MAKKTKKTGAKSRKGRTDRVDSAIEAVQLERRERALKRVLEWAWLERALDHALDHAEEGSDSLARWGDPERRVAFNDFVPTHFEGEELPNVTNRRFRSVLKIATARCYLLGASPDPFVALSTWFDPREAEGKWASFERSFGETETVAKFSTSLASAIKLVRRLLEEDLALAKSHASVPSNEDLDLLRRLRNRPKTAKELAVEIAGKGNAHKVDEKRVERAIERLRDVHGFELPNTRGEGYSLSKSDRARLDKLDGGT
jgi:hypothetical protein